MHGLSFFHEYVARIVGTLYNWTMLKYISCSRVKSSPTKGGWVYFMLPADHLYTNSNYCSTTNQLFASSIFVNGCFSYRNTVSTLGSLFPESIYRSYSGSYKSTKQLPHRRHKIHQHAVQAPRHRYADPLAGPGRDGLGLLLQELGPQQPVLAGLDSSR